MKIPSIKRLMARLNVSRETAKEMRKVMMAAETPAQVDESFKGLSKLLDGHGSEVIRCSAQWERYWLDIALQYVNMGDTYTQTVVFDVGAYSFRVGTWGDWLEVHEKRCRSEHNS